MDAGINNFFETGNVFHKELPFTPGKVLALQIALEHHLTPHKLVMQDHLNNFSKIF